MSSSKQSLFEFVEVDGKKYITSHLFHEQVKPTGAVKTTNNAIRNAPTYEKLREESHILEIDKTSSRDAVLLNLLLKANSYRPVMLLDAVAQKEMEHHFKVTSTQAVTSSKESAMLGLLGIDLAVLAENQEALQAVKDIHDAQRDGKPLPIAQLKKTPFTKRLDEALLAAKKLKQLSKAVSVPYSSAAILKILGEEYELDLEGLRANAESTQPPQLESIPALTSLPPCKSEWMLPKDLAKYLTEHIGISFSAQKVNQLLIDAGLQVSKGSNGAGPYQVTEKGNEISTQTEVQVTTFKGIKFQYQIHWDKDRTLEKITDYIEI